MGALCRLEASIAGRQIRPRVAAPSILFRVAAVMTCRMLLMKASAALTSNQRSDSRKPIAG